MIYLDHASMAPLEPAAYEAMSRAARESWGNPRSIHAAGRKARIALDRARMEVAVFLGCDADELHWTASASAALSRAIAWARTFADGPLACTRMEHPAMLDALAAPATDSKEVRWLPTPRGALEPALVRGASVIVTSAMNHELGIVPPIAAMRAHARDALFIVDAVQAAAWLDLSALFDDRTILVCAGQKLGAAAGIAIVRIPRRLRERAAPLIAALERGTPPVILAAGMGAACRARAPDRAASLDRATALATSLFASLQSVAPRLMRNGNHASGPILSTALDGFPSRELEAALDFAGVCVSRGSACTRAMDIPAPAVLAAYPDEPWRAQCTVRWSLGWNTTKADVDAATRAFHEILRAHRRLKA